MQSLSYMIYTQVVFFIVHTVSAFTYFLISLSFSVCWILIFCMDHFSVIHIFIDPLKADEWELFVRDGFHPYMPSSFPGSTRNSSDSDINNDYPVSMETNEPELTDGLRRAKRQVRVFIFDISCFIFFFFLKIIHAQQAAEKGIIFSQREVMVKVLYRAQEFLTKPCLHISDDRIAGLTSY